MLRFIDLSHPFEDSMPGFKLWNEDGTFEITEMTFQTSVGTYLDAPYHRYPHGRDISEIRIEELILPGVGIDARRRSPCEKVGMDVISSRLNLRDKAVLFNFGWDVHWGTEAYQAYPYIGEELIDFLLGAGVALVGVDTVNIDNSQDLTRPAHTRFLAREIFIVENLTQLERLHGQEFRFFAVPVKAKKVAAMPIRAFVEVQE